MLNVTNVYIVSSFHKKEMIKWQESKKNKKLFNSLDKESDKVHA